MTVMTASDGCILPNIPVSTYRAIYVPECEHVKIQSVIMDFTAISLESATEYARKWIRLPRMRVHRVYEISAEENRNRVRWSCCEHCTHEGSREAGHIRPCTVPGCPATIAEINAVSAYPSEIVNSDPAS